MKIADSKRKAQKQDGVRKRSLALDQALGDVRHAGFNASAKAE
jgi:hypothetical protein